MSKSKAISKPTIPICIEIHHAPNGVGYALQDGAGQDGTSLQYQEASDVPLRFFCEVQVKLDGDAQPDFGGPFVQGAKGERFIYLRIGASAGQANSPWQRRMKISMQQISASQIQACLNDRSLQLLTQIEGLAKDGSPVCASVKPVPEWELIPS